MAPTLLIAMNQINFFNNRCENYFPHLSVGRKKEERLRQRTTALEIYNANKTKHDLWFSLLWLFYYDLTFLNMNEEHRGIIFM